jgi:hypothetical protein
MIVRNTPKMAGRPVVGANVSDVTDMQCFAIDQAGGRGAAHTTAILLPAAPLINAVLCGPEGLQQTTGRVFAGGRGIYGSNDRLDRKSACDLAGVVSAHSIGDDPVRSIRGQKIPVLIVTSFTANIGNST